MTYNPTSAVEAAKLAQVQAEQAANAAKERAAQAQRDAQNAQNAQQVIYNKGVSACLSGIDAIGGDLPGLFSQGAFTAALQAVNLRIAQVQRQASVVLNLASNGSSQRAADVAASAAENLVSAQAELATLQSQIDALVSAVLEASAPACPDGADDDDCSGFKDDFKAIISNGTVNTQAQLLMHQLRAEQRSLELYALLGTPCRYMLQGLGVKRSLLLGSYVSGVFADIQAEVDARYPSATPDAKEFYAVGVRQAYSTPWSAALTPALYDLAVQNLGATVVPAARALMGQ